METNLTQALRDEIARQDDVWIRLQRDLAALDIDTLVVPKSTLEAIDRAFNGRDAAAHPF